ncbi:FAD:protein FMN transferase [Bombilactobacillus bombi]|uniref:FAD:protein FMN transferase n=1 Tax=Bombilactobacillus bombi TaxID=1303590 RepID=UPI0015E5C0F6|nr:FAD:protein FMN transferase [Bombilactobacillus bombi]MBA1434027.1 FAD:protein FMN transferase [Bombilactobacillus bombi]
MSRLQKSYYGLGTLINLTLFGNPYHQELDKTNELIKYYEDLFTVNRAQSEVMQINHAAGNYPVVVSDATYNLIKKAILVSQENFGFNALIGPLVKLWRIGFANAHVPTPEQIQERLQLTNPADCILNDYNSTVFLKRNGMELDLGAIAKGYIADRIQDYWLALGKSAGMIDLGGNLLLMGASPLHANGQWSIGIQDPQAQRGQAIAAVHWGACSAVTSGIYERHFEVQNHSYHHILDPRTGYPHDNELASVTIFSQKSIDGEIETERLFFADGPLTNWAQDRPDIYGAIFVTKNKKIILQKLPRMAVSLLDDQYEIIE